MYIIRGREASPEAWARASRRGTMRRASSIPGAVPVRFCHGPGASGQGFGPLHGTMSCSAVGPTGFGCGASVAGGGSMLPAAGLPGQGKRSAPSRPFRHRFHGHGHAPRRAARTRPAAHRLSRYECLRKRSPPQSCALRQARQNEVRSKGAKEDRHRRQRPGTIKALIRNKKPITPQAEHEWIPAVHVAAPACPGPAAFRFFLAKIPMSRRCSRGNGQDRTR